MKKILGAFWKVISAVLWVVWCIFLVVVIIRFNDGNVTDVNEFILKVVLMSIFLMLIDLKITLMEVKKESRNSAVFITVFRDYLKSK